MPCAHPLASLQLFGEMAFPEIHLTGGASTPLNLTSYVNITNQDGFTGFATQLMVADTVTLNMYSHVNIKAAGLQYNSIVFNKDMTLKGACARAGSVLACLPPGPLPPKD